MITLGSLFDGSGGFPLAGALSGITPLWASEIEPYPIAVTTSRFPQMKHLGNVAEVDGRKIPPVDIITFGSPCQDMSVAGKRVGMKHREKGDNVTTRSGLFYEAIRIIREMREATNGRYPTFAIWENVPGAFSSNGGEDFRCVLEEFAKICGGCAIPRPANGKWRHAGEIVGDGFSIAWRVLDAQYWGVPQRRKRIYLVADFAGERAGKILFERESVRGNSSESGEARKGIAPGTESGAGTAGECISAGGFCTEHSADSRGIGYGKEESPTLRAGVVPGVAIEYNPSDCRLKVKEDGICQTLTARCGTGGNNVPLTIGEPTVYGICSDQSHSMLSDNPHSGIYEAETSRTLDCNGCSPVCNQGGMAVVETYAIQGNMIGREEKNGPQGDGINREVAFTLDTVDRHAVYAMTTGSFTQLDEEKSPPLMARDYKDPPINSPTAEYLVRRLTPDECCRLQGFPDRWGVPKHKDAMDDCEVAYWEGVRRTYAEIAGKTYKPFATRAALVKWYNGLHTDSAEYKMWGNGVALPCAYNVVAGCAEELRRT